MLAALAAPCAAAAGRPWDVRTSVETRYFVDQPADDWVFWSSAARPVAPSPDGSHFFVVTSRGDLQADLNVAELSIYSTEAVRAAVRSGRRPAPIRTIRRTSASNLPPISNARWTREGDRIAFEGATEDREGETLAFGLDLASGQVVQLTETVENAMVQTRRSPNILSWRGDVALYNGYLAGGVDPPPPAPEYPMSSVSFDLLLGIAGARREGTRRPSRSYQRGIFLYRAGERRLLVRDNRLRDAWLSPDGAHALVLLERESEPVPASWSGYANAPGRPSRLRLLDTVSGEMRAILDAPVAAGADARPDVVWAADGRSALLIGTALPLAADRPDRRSTHYVASFDVADGMVVEVAPLSIDGARVTHAAWEAGGAIRVDYRSGAAARSRRFVRSGRQWAPVGEVTAAPPRLDWRQEEAACADNRCPSSQPHGEAAPLRFSNGLALRLEEGANAPQRLVASVASRSVMLIDRDPRIADVTLAQSRIVEWTAPDGQVERGLLTVPPGASAADPPPLVVQVYNYMPTLFRPDGPYPSPYAAQALAARGVAVLGIALASLERPSIGGTPQEGPAMVRSIDGFVDTLAAQGLIDPARVGVTGHSRAGYMTIFAATHPGTTRMRAFFDFDGYLADFSSYAYRGTLLTRQVERENGGALGRTFWQAKQDWIANSPEFNLERVQAPFFYAASGILNRLDMARALGSLLGGFALNRRPYESTILPFGQHPLARPRERYELLSVMVDWMSYWLQGEAPADPERAARWARMRADWERQQAWEAAGNPPGSEPPADFALFVTPRQ